MPQTLTLTSKETLLDKAKKRVSRLLPCREWLAEYNSTKLIYDCLAGLTCALIVVPQSLSYAKIIHVPVEHGLYASLLCGIPYALFGTSRDIALGPTAVLSLVIAAVIEDCEGDQCVQWAAGTAFLAGIMQTIMGLLNLGALIALMSHSVITGFCSGAAIIVIASQIPQWLGRPARRPFFQCLEDIYHQLPHANPYNMVMGISVFVILLVLKHFAPKIQSQTGKIIMACRNVFVIVVTILISYIWETSAGKNPFTTVGFIPSGLPIPHLPSLDFGDDWNKLARGAFVMAMIGFAETFSIGTTYSALRAKKYAQYQKDLATAQASDDDNSSQLSSGLSDDNVDGNVTADASTSVKPKFDTTHAPPQPRRISANQELVAVGVANLLAAIMRGFSVTGSMARTAVANACGVYTPLANLWSVGVCVAALCFFTEALRYTPQAALASVIIAGVLGIVDLHSIKEAMQLGPQAYIDACLNTLTLVSVLCLGVEEGLVVGMLAHLGSMIYKQADPMVIAHGMTLVTRTEDNTNTPSASSTSSSSSSSSSSSASSSTSSASVSAVAVGSAVHIEVIGPIHYISAARLTAKFRKVREHYVHKLCQHCETAHRQGQQAGITCNHASSSTSTSTSASTFASAGAGVGAPVGALALSVNSTGMDMDIVGMGSSTHTRTNNNAGMGYTSPIPLPIDSTASKEDTENAQIIIRDELTCSESALDISQMKRISEHHDGTYTFASATPYCAVILDISKACELDMSGIHTIISLCDSLARSPPCCHPAVTSIHIVLSTQVQDWFEQESVTSKLALGFPALPLSAHLHYSLAEAMHTAHVEGLLVAAYMQQQQVRDGTGIAVSGDTGVPNASVRVKNTKDAMTQPLLSDALTHANTNNTTSSTATGSAAAAAGYAALVAQVEKIKTRFTDVEHVQQWLREQHTSSN